MDIKIKTIPTYGLEKLDLTWSINLWNCDRLFLISDNECFVAYLDGVPIGYQMVSVSNKTLAIEVHPNYRNRGIATKLMERSGSCKPFDDCNKEFWNKIDEKFGSKV